MALNKTHEPNMPDASPHKQPASEFVHLIMAPHCARVRPLQRQPRTRWRLSFTGLTISTHSPPAQPGRRCNSQPLPVSLYTVSAFTVCKVNRDCLCRPFPYRPGTGFDARSGQAADDLWRADSGSRYTLDVLAMLASVRFCSDATMAEGLSGRTVNSR